MCRFYDSSDSTILPQELYESDVPIVLFFRFYDFLQWMKERGKFVEVHISLFSDLAIIALYW